jgi:hypothetical protein
MCDRVAARVAGKLAAHGLAVARDPVGEFRRDDVPAGAAAHRVAPDIRLGHEVVRAGAPQESIATRSADEQVWAASSRQAVVSGVALQDVGAVCPEQPVRPRAAGAHGSRTRSHSQKEGETRGRYRPKGHRSEHSHGALGPDLATIGLPVMTSARRFSQAISEGDGISVIAEVADAESARTAGEQGAEGLIVAGSVGGLRESTPLPILWRGEGPPSVARAAGADACLLEPRSLDAEGREQLERLNAEASKLGLDCVVRVRDEEELEVVLDRLDPEILLLSGDRPDGDETPLDAVLRLLGDVPAGKLAVADVQVSDRDEIAELERAGVDAVIVAAASVALLVGAMPPEV